MQEDVDVKNCRVLRSFGTCKTVKVKEEKSRRRKYEGMKVLFCNACELYGKETLQE